MNPRPFTAMSRGCSVTSRLPWENCLEVPTMRTPVPSWRPDGSSRVLGIQTTGLPVDLVQQILKHRAVALETGGVHVGQVV